MKAVMAAREPSALGVQFVFDLRLVLLGNKAAGKSSLANLITGHAEPRRTVTAQCVKLHGEFAGRQVTVIDTPGWWKNFSAKETPEFQKQEIVLSIAHCAPGPHAVLLVIRVDALFKEKHRRSVQEHLEILGERVWSHAVVVFTYRDHIQEKTLAECIGSEAESLLLWLVEKCGRRYHVLNIERARASQLKELLEIIDAMVMGNGDCHFEMDRKWLHRVEGKMTKRYTRANQRRKIVQDQWQSPLGRQGHKQIPIQKMRIILLGPRRAGKSSAGNTILRTATPTSRRTSACVRRQGEVNGRHVTIVDTPGWWKSLSVAHTPERDKQELLFSSSLCPAGAHTLLLTLRVDMAFTQEERKSMEEHMALLGEQVWVYTMVLFTHGDCLGDVTIEEFIEGEGEALQGIVERCGNRYHVLDNENWNDGGQVTNLLDKIERMVAQNKGRCYEMELKTVKEVKQKWKEAEEKAKARVKRCKQMKNTVKEPAKTSGLTLVLLGYEEAGKSWTGNTIFGREMFGSGRTDRCIQRHGEVHGQKITIVDTPGWCKHLPTEQNPTLIKQQITQMQALNLSGALAFLLVLRADCSFKEPELQAMKEHLSLLGSRVWDQGIVVFTFEEQLGDRGIELQIECEGVALQWLVDRCGNRYHTFKDTSTSERQQVRELLEKIQRMVQANADSDWRNTELREVTQWKKIEEGRVKRLGVKEGSKSDEDSRGKVQVEMEEEESDDVFDDGEAEESSWRRN